jgi:hypothetical protein
MVIPPELADSLGPEERRRGLLPPVSLARAAVSNDCVPPLPA